MGALAHGKLGHLRMLRSSLHRGLFPLGVIVHSAAPGEIEGALYDEEEQQIARAVEKRRAEYRAARVLARRALSELGLPPSPIVNAPDRAPIFPEGCVGTITHTRSLCLVALAHADDYLALGADVEAATPLKESLFETILRPEEQAALRELDPSDRALRAKLIFSIKEAAYKAQYPLSKRYFGFSGMRVEVQDGMFEAEMTIDAPPFPQGHRFRGRYAIEGGLILSALALPRDQGAI